MPQQPDGERLEQKKEAIRAHLQDCLEMNDQGQIELKLKLPDQSALDNIAAALAKLAG
jgi:hypothetical protein